jgi:hypothetical protein
MYTHSNIHSKLLFLILFYSVFTSEVFGQNNYQEAFYITWDNDTVYGLINNRGGAGNSLNCMFKQDESSNAVKYSPDDILGYRFADGQYYLSKKINIEDKEAQVFVEFLVDGISNLYFYRDLDHYFYIIENESGDLLELYREEIEEGVEGEGQIKRDTYRHIRMLKLAFADCMEIQPRVERADLSHKSLIKLTRNYHEYVCEDEQECIVYEKKLGPTRIYFAPVIGVTASTLQFDREFYSRFAYDHSLDLTLGFQVNAILTRIHERFALQLDVLYSKNSFYGTYNNYYDLYVDNNVLQTSFLARYNFPKGKVRPSFGFGILGNFIMDIKAKAYVDNIPGSPPQEQELEDIYMATNLIGGVAQVGLNYRVFKHREMFTNFRYAISGGSKRGTNGFVKTTLSSINLSVGFYLAKVE